jgi:AraC-like DNA-binding protein/ligand-binding sensor protein
MRGQQQAWMSRERAKGRPQQDSLLEELFELLQQAGPLKISFEDLSGVARDVPFLQLSAWEQQHTCRFCLFAKKTVKGYQDCGMNKYAVNRIVLSRMAGFHGQCHLGLTDLVEPLVFHQRVLGIFYYGSVVLEGTEEKARQRILRYCKRSKLKPRPYLEELQRVARISKKDLLRHQKRLRFAARLAAALLESWGLPEERYRAEVIGPLWASPEKYRNLPALVQATVHYVQKHYFEPLQIRQIAGALSVHPVHLSRTFKKAMECDLREYLQRVRVDHARQRLKYSQLSVAEIGYEVGFQEKSHFGRIFTKLVGVSPGEYRRQLPPMNHGGHGEHRG